MFGFFYKVHFHLLNDQLFFLLFYLGYKAFGLNKAIYIAILTAFSALTALTIVNLIKNYFYTF